MSEWWQSDTAQSVIVSIGILLAAGVVAALARLIFGPVLRKLSSRTETKLDDIVIRALQRPLVSLILVAGLWGAVRHLPYWRPTDLALINKVASVAVILIVVAGVLRVFNAVSEWLVENAADRSSRPREVRSQALVGRKVVSIAILVVGILVALTQLGIEIGPLLAGLGIGGLAVALALQDTLSNLFAGIYMMVDRPVAVGDFVKLESGEEGFIEEIGWRNTKVRMWANNIVIIPNSKLSQSVVTNYFLPRQEMSVYISCGVAYDSDLEHVERVCIEVGKEVMERIAGSATDWTPVVRYKEFADFSINFLVILRVTDFSAQYLLGHEYIKALHRRFNPEGIEIPFPIRTVIMPSARPGPTAAPIREVSRGTAPDATEVGSDVGAEEDV